MLKEGNMHPNIVSLYHNDLIKLLKLLSMRHLGTYEKTSSNTSRVRLLLMTLYYCLSQKYCYLFFYFCFILFFLLERGGECGLAMIVSMEQDSNSSEGISQWEANVRAFQICVIHSKTSLVRNSTI